MDFSLDLTEIVIALFGLFFNVMLGIITSRVVPWIKEKGLDKYAKALVSVAYTMFADGSGADKFNYAFDRLATSKYGKLFDEDRLKEAIQAAYVELCTELGQIPAPVHAENFIIGELNEKD